MNKEIVVLNIKPLNSGCLSIMENLNFPSSPLFRGSVLFQRLFCMECVYRRIVLYHIEVSL